MAGIVNSSAVGFAQNFVGAIDRLHLRLKGRLLGVGNSFKQKQSSLKTKQKQSSFKTKQNQSSFETKQNKSSFETKQNQSSFETKQNKSSFETKHQNYFFLSTNLKFKETLIRHNFEIFILIKTLTFLTF